MRNTIIFFFRMGGTLVSAFATAILNANDIREIVSLFGVSIQWSLLTFLLFLGFVLWWIGSLEYQLRKIRNAQPNIDVDVRVVPETLQDVHTRVVVGIPIFAKLLVTNNPISISSGVDAPNVAARIEFFGDKQLLFPEMVGRWANTQHQIQGALPNEVAQMTLHPNGLPEPLLIALKYTDEEMAYGLNVDNERKPGWRDPNKPIPTGTWPVKVHLRCINVKKTVCLILKNKGKGVEIELELEPTQQIADKGDSQT